MSLSSQSNKTENLPPTARAIALILSSTPSVQDAQPGVLHQLLEFANRYTQHVLTDARVYAEHKQGGAEGNKVEAEDVVLAVQARVGWEFGGRVPAEYIQSLATQTNSIPLPSVPEVFGVRLPPQSECLTAIDFDLVPNKPPPGIKIFDEEIEEIEESEEEEDEDEDMDMEPAPIPDHDFAAPEQRVSPEQAPFPITAAAPFEDVMPVSRPGEGSDDDEDGLFAGGDDDSEADAMEEVRDEAETTRKLVETDDYD
ncbi:transcription initiation factor tfiid subunit 9 [Moniliophthora roreri MCA 2997]|uniref:Transcription initiation factor tfiid subunit 9 n=1 Tax=Moniliophthora roreri (strain MCA 2997) TaxID=1381753 RepID=V2Z0Q5_MONRO|nr:transcription initiation factor tfiid subunit 9 [Moniliophthora roreri MCA 2997]KAI3612413.1 transcription initiation factor tfiid subunit 9 [Moniliophthora roreri]